jgi:hypothetical protein
MKTRRPFSSCNPTAFSVMPLNISIKEAVRLLCKFGFMNGFFGDTSPEFQEEQVDLISSLPTDEQTAWLANQEFNLRNYCLPAS